MLLSEVLVQQQTKETLLNMVKSGRVSHAQLFLGQQGTPSLALALAFVQYIACQNRTETDSCGHCPSCVKISKIAFPDLHFFFPTTSDICLDFYPQWRELMLEKNAFFSVNQWIEAIDAKKELGIKVKDINLLIEQTASKPYEAEYKFFIIWLPEKMNKEAANKLLKTLEEPDGKTLIILVSENKDKLLPTILSRTQQLTINKFNSSAFVEVVADKVGCDYDTAIEIASITDFNLQQAISQGMNVVDAQNYERFVEMMRSAFRMVMFSNSPAKVEFEKTHQWLDDIKKIGREEQKRFLLYSLSLIRKCILINCGAKTIVKSPTEEEKWLKSFSPFINKKNGAQMVSYFNNAIEAVSSNANAQILFVDLLLYTGQSIQMAYNEMNKK